MMRSLGNHHYSNRAHPFYLSKRVEFFLIDCQAITNNPAFAQLYLFIILMQIQNNVKERLIQQYKQTIASKEYRNSGKIIHYDWKTAELSLVNHISLQNCQSACEVLKFLKELQELYKTKYIPSFYSYFVIYSIFQRNIDICSELQLQINRTIKSENDYQNIALLIYIRDNLIKQFTDRAHLSNEEVEKYRNTTILSIIKVQEWQQSFQKIIDYPTFFLWEDQPYLLQLLQKNEGLLLNKERQSFLPQPNPLLLKEDSQFLKQQIVNECLTILKAQKARSLQLSLNLPFFARNKAQSRTKIAGNSNQKIIKLKNQIIFSKRKIMSTQTNLKNLPSEELNVIKKFRSLKNMKAVPKDLKPHLQFQSIIDKKIKSRIQDLKEKVKNKTQSSQIHEVSQPKHRNIGISMKIRLQKQIQELMSPKKQFLDSLNLLKHQKSLTNSHIIKSSKASFKDERQANEKKMEKIKQQTQFLLQNRTKQHQQLKIKNQTLKNLKQNLIQKVKEKCSSFKHEKHQNIKIDANEVKSRQMNHLQAKEKVKNILFEKIEQQKRQLDQKKRILIQQKIKIEEQFTNRQRELTEKQRISKQIQTELNMKKIKVKHLHVKLEQTKSKVKQVQQSDTMIEIQKLKQKKYVEYEHQKQKIQQVQSTLQNRLKQEAERYASLESQQVKREAEIKRQFQEEVIKLKEKQQRQQSLILQKIKQQGERQALYEAKIKQEEQRLEYMQKEIQEWEHQQQQLLRTIKQQQKKQQEKESLIRKQRQKRIERQMQELQQQQIQFLSKCKLANQHLIDQLEELKSKNNQLEQILSIHQ